MFASDLLLASAILASSPAVLPLMTVVPVPDLFVHSTGATHGYVKDKFGANIYGSAASPQPYPLTWALEHTGQAGGTGPFGPTYGYHVYVNAGSYSPFIWRIGATSPQDVNWIGSSAANPVVIEGASGAVIKRNPGAGSDTLLVLSDGNPNHPFNYVTWRNMKFETSTRAGILIGSGADPAAGIPFRSWRFENCEIDGLWDHKTGVGNLSMWGMLTWALSDFVWTGGSVHDIQEQHGFYLHNNLGNVTIEDVDIYETGRTAIQITARKYEGGPLLPPNPGNIVIRNCVIADTGLFTAGLTADGQPYDDNYHNGQSITIVGRQNGLTEVYGNYVAFGLDTFTPGLRAAILARPDYPTNKPYGSGAFVSWTTSSESFETSLMLQLHSNRFVYEANSAANVPVVVSAFRGVCVRNNLVLSGVRTEAMSIGSAGNPNHPTPTFYDVKANVLTTGAGSPAFVTLSGVPTAQPFLNLNLCP